MPHTSAWCKQYRFRSVYMHIIPAGLVKLDDLRATQRNIAIAVAAALAQEISISLPFSSSSYAIAQCARMRFIKYIAFT